MISKTMNHRTENFFKSRFITHPPLKLVDLKNIIGFLLSCFLFFIRFLPVFQEGGIFGWIFCIKFVLACFASIVAHSLPCLWLIRLTMLNAACFICIFAVLSNQGYLCLIVNAASTCNLWDLFLDYIPVLDCVGCHCWMSLLQFTFSTVKISRLQYRMSAFF